MTSSPAWSKIASAYRNMHVLLLPSRANTCMTRSIFRIWRQQLWSSHFLRFLVVGMGNTIFGYLLYLIGLALDVPYQFALVGATILGTVFNFFTTGRIVFESRALSKILGFFLVYGVTLAVNLALLTWLVQAGVPKALAQGVLLPLIVLLSFFLNKHLVFGRPS